MKKHNLYATAVHEAGHAVIGRVTGMLCGKATIMSDHDSAGHVITKDPWEILAHWEKHGKSRHDHSVYIGRILTYMAGREAQIELAGCSDEEKAIAMTVIKLRSCSKKPAFRNGRKPDCGSSPALL